VVTAAAVTITKTPRDTIIAGPTTNKVVVVLPVLINKDTLVAVKRKEVVTSAQNLKLPLALVARNQILSLNQTKVSFLRRRSSTNNFTRLQVVVHHLHDLLNFSKRLPTVNKVMLVLRPAAAAQSLSGQYN